MRHTDEFRTDRLIPLGGAHPDAWRCLFPPRGLRLYVVDSLAIMAPDPDSAWRMLAETAKAPPKRG